jgi:Fungal Zn(2)-Cys(6) binuclear cluster domain
MEDPEFKFHECDQCGRKFGRGEHLRRHAVIHAKVKAFQCESCHRRFSRQFVPSPLLTGMELTRCRDSLFRHYRYCELSQPQGASPREKRRPCDRCKALKIKCSRGIPCERCEKTSAQCVVSRPSSKRRNIETTPPSHPSQMMSSTTVSESLATFTDLAPPPPLSPFNPSTADILPEPLDWDSLLNALGLPSSDVQLEPLLDLSQEVQPEPFLDLNQDYYLCHLSRPALPETLSPHLSHQTDWDFDAFSLEQLDPFESQRLCVVDYVRRAGSLTPGLASYLTPEKVKLYFRCYFGRFQDTAPFLHLPTFDVRKVSSSLFFAMLIAGGHHSGDAETIEAMRVLWPFAESFVTSHLQVLPVHLIELMEGGSAWECRGGGYCASFIPCFTV